MGHCPPSINQSLTNWVRWRTFSRSSILHVISSRASICTSSRTNPASQRNSSTILSRIHFGFGKPEVPSTNPESRVVPSHNTSSTLPAIYSSGLPCSQSRQSRFIFSVSSTLTFRAAHRISKSSG